MASPTTDRRLGLVGNTAIKAPVRVIATSNITLSGLQTIDGATLAADDRVLCTGQTAGAENLIYNASTGAWTLAKDSNGNYDLVKGTTVQVTDGTTYAGSYWRISTSGSITVGTTSITWERALANSLSAMSFTQAGTGAVTRGGQDKMREVEINVEDFGSLGNSSTGDDSVLQLAMDYLHKLSDDSGVFGTLAFDGTIYLASPKNWGKNTRFVGRGRGFRSTIKPLAAFSGSYLFAIDGDNCIGGYAFRIRHEGFTIDNTLVTTKAALPKTYVIDKAYDILLRDVWVYNFRGTAIEIGASNHVVLESPSLYGVSAAVADSEYGIRVISGGAGGGGGGVKILNPDIEVCYKGISQEADSRVEVLFPYMERNIIGWEAGGTTSGVMDVVGGQITSPGASGVAANIAGPNVTVTGGVYTANGGSGLVVDVASRRDNVKLRGVKGDISDLRNYAERDNANTTRWYPSKVRNQKTVTDAAATTFYNIICPNSAGYFGVCEVTLNARDDSGYSLWTARYRFAFTNPDGTLRVTAVTEYGRANVNISANYSLSVTCALSNVGTTISFQVTADSGGALGNGQSPRVSTEAEMVQWDSSGPVYIQAV